MFLLVSWQTRLYVRLASPCVATDLWPGHNGGGGLMHFNNRRLSSIWKLPWPPAATKRDSAHLSSAMASLHTVLDMAPERGCFLAHELSASSQEIQSHRDAFTRFLRCCTLFPEVRCAHSCESADMCWQGGGYVMFRTSAIFLVFSENWNSQCMGVRVSF